MGSILMAMQECRVECRIMFTDYVASATLVSCSAFLVAGGDCYLFRCGCACANTHEITTLGFSLLTIIRQSCMRSRLQRQGNGGRLPWNNSTMATIKTCTPWLILDYHHSRFTDTHAYMIECIFMVTEGGGCTAIRQ